MVRRHLSEIADMVYYVENGRIAKNYPADAFYRMSEPEREALGLRQLHAIPQNRNSHINHGEEVLTAQNISAAYGKKQILDGLFFKACAGDVIGITGKNGAGKTTLCRSVCGLMKLSGGRFFLHQKACSEKQLQQKSYLIMQDVNHQLFGESVEDECQISLEPEEYPKAEMILEQMQLLPYRKAHPMSLSGGQKQRLAIAAGMLQEKEIYLFDEPTSGLDYTSMLQVKEQIETLAGKGACVFIITHDMELLDLLCNRCFFMRDAHLTEIFANRHFSEIVLEMLSQTGQ